MDVSAMDQDSSCLSSSSASEIEIVDVPPRKKGIAATLKRKFSKYRRPENSKPKKENKCQSNQISNDDYAIKKQEFLKWLQEEKKIQPCTLDEKRRTALFKKFVKKWNGKKLPAHYYRETESLWIMTSPFSPPVTRVLRSKSIAGSSRDLQPGAQKNLNLTQPASSPCSSSTPTKPQFGTFGKKSGARMLTELRKNDFQQLKQSGITAARSERNVAIRSCYDSSVTGYETLNCESSFSNGDVLCSELRFSSFRSGQQSRYRRPLSSAFPQSSTFL